MSTPVIQPVLQPGQVGYRDHTDAALSRLLEQFRGPRPDTPVRPLFVTSAPATFTVTTIGLSTFNNVNVVIPPACLEGDTVLLAIASDFTLGVPSTLPPTWSVLSQLSPAVGLNITLLRHDIGEFEPPTHTIQLAGGLADVGCGLVVYRMLEPGQLLLAGAAVAVSSISPPSIFSCPSQTVADATDMYLGLTWSQFGPVDTTVPGDCATRLSVNQTVNGFSGLQLTMFDTVPGVTGPTGTKDVSVDAGCSGIAASYLLRFFAQPVDLLNSVGRLVTALCRPIQDLENTMQQVLLQRGLNNAVGAQIDAIGKLVAQPRNGADDDTYRKRCRATIAAHRSAGTTEDLIQIASLVVDDPGATFAITTQQVATVVAQVLGVGITDQVASLAAQLLRKATAAGVRMVLQYGNVYPVFQLDSGPGLDSGHLAGEISL